ncbi:MAG: MFS transporter [Candidatus Coatesbacteria bacterium]|nr:MFS transporter [Candidatus Coatesbacteria bacterium]
MSDFKRNLLLFLIGVFCFGLFDGIMTSTFNNFLNDRFGLNAEERGQLEFPRELPGLSIALVTGSIAFFAINKQAFLATLFSAIGALGLSQFIRIDGIPNFTLLIFFMLFWAMGDHLFIPVRDSLALKFSSRNREGHRLGQVEGMRMSAYIVGSGFVWLLMGKFFKNKLSMLKYEDLYLLASSFVLVGSVLFLFMKVSNPSVQTRRFVFRKEYKLYYLLNIFFGGRKQLFLTFGPWVLITKFGATPSNIAGLIMIASIIGVFFRPLLGKAVDKFGERLTMIVDGVVLMIICMGYALGEQLLGKGNAFYLLCTCYVIDNLFFAVRIARTTYLKKILVDKEDLIPTLSFGVSIDHIVSMTLPILGGFIWKVVNYQAVFWFASLIAIMIILTSWRIETRRD